MKKAGLLTSAGLLEHLLVRATTHELKRRVIRLTPNLSRFEAAGLLLRWRDGLASELKGEIDALLVSLLEGYGRSYYTRPPAELLARLNVTGAQAGPELRQVLSAYNE